MEKYVEAARRRQAAPQSTEGRRHSETCSQSPWAPFAGAFSFTERLRNGACSLSSNDGHLAAGAPETQRLAAPRFPSTYRALLLELDGTLVGSDGGVRPRTLDAIRRADARGVRVMIATGRSELAARSVLDALSLDSPAIVYNGAALYCPREKSLVERRTLTDAVRDRILDYAAAHDYLPVVMVEGAKYSLAARSSAEDLALHDMHNLTIAGAAALRAPNAIRITLFSERHPTSDIFARELLEAVGDPVYVTHFPLSLLANHRTSPILVLDVHPPCRGKAEAFRVLESRYGIPAARTVAVGDATNDLTMLEGAGLGVAMAESEEIVRDAADRVIGSCDSDTIAQLIEELFL